jgi:hypothetical protein
MEKRIKIFWTAGFFLSAINATVFTRYMKIKRMGIKEILRRISLISANKIKTSESVNKQSSQLKLELNSSL